MSLSFAFEKTLQAWNIGSAKLDAGRRGLAVAMLRRLVAGLRSGGPTYSSSWRFVMKDVALGNVVLRIPENLPPSIIPPLHQIHLPISYRQF